MRYLLFIPLVTVCFSFSCRGQLKNVLNKENIGKKTGTIIKSGNSNGLSNEEVVRGLKEALTIGSSRSAELAGRVDGFYKDARLFIPWPQEALEMKTRLVKMGFADKVNEFEMSLNRAAEEAARQATPVFTAAVMNMSVQDGFAILKGSDTAATNYLRKTTYEPLKEKFMPVVKEAIRKVQVTRYWDPLVTAYNMVPGVKKQNPDLEEYVTGKAINGLMVLIADEEARIRKDPMARVTDLLKKVFGK